MSSQLLRLDTVEGITPLTDALGNAGGGADGPGASPANAFRSWSVSGDPIDVFAQVLAEATREGMHFDTISCSANAPDPHLIAGGAIQIDGWVPGVTLSLIAEPDGPPRLQAFLSASAGVGPQVMPSGPPLVVDSTCSRALIRAAGVR